MAELDDLEQKVAEERVVADGAMVLLNGIHAELAAVLAAQVVDKSRLVALSAKIDAEKQAWADAVAANTDAAPPAPEPVPEPEPAPEPAPEPVPEPAP